jgi:NDP-sugar pyrophosphorylase family protein
MALLVMAAGSGSRYGGLKQIESLGPNGETIIDYSIFDALRAGFQKVVFVIRRDIEDLFIAAVGRRIEKQVQVAYVFQDEIAPSSRAGDIPRSWGTAHAILSAVDAIDDPFCVINADDYSGAESFQILAGQLNSGASEALMVGFLLEKTLSEFGPVKRGLCEVRDGMLRNVTELEQIERDGSAIKCVDADGRRLRLRGDETVSMNMWGFAPAIFDEFRTKWADFVITHSNDEPGEFYIPSVVTALINDGRCKCRVLETKSSWFGITYRDDLSIARARLLELISEGLYPQDLWSE